MHGNLKEGTGRGSHLSLVMPPSRAERAKWWIVTVLPVLPVVVLAAVAVAAATLWYRPAKQQSGLFDNLGQAVQAMQAGGSAANAAATAASPQPPGSLSVSALNAALPRYEWVDGAVNVPYSSERPVVGMIASGTHIETAVRPVRKQCSFGLTITSSTDPLIAEDDLPGPGTYFQPADQVPCAANQAPTSGWASWTQGLEGVP
jgi:hypothetical protein